jgi:ABC-2 type transport system ATP-binding protein
MGEPAVVAEGLRRVFDETVAVDGVDLRVERGEIYGFLGPNGAGKSTTVRILCTLLAPSGGRATVAGHDVETDAGGVRLQIGVALQDAALDDQQTGRELLTLQARLFGLSKAETEERLQDLTKFIDIGDALDRRIKTYSGGMKRRLDLAAALVHNPEVLFLDEPTTGLDPISRNRVWEEVRRLNDELGMTIFLTTQYLEEADELAHRVAIIDQGRIVAEDTPDALKRALGADVIVARVDGDVEHACSRLEQVAGIEHVRSDGDTITIRATHGDEAIGEVAVVLHDCGIAIRSLTLRTPTLDDVFLSLTGAHLQEDDS